MKRQDVGRLASIAATAFEAELAKMRGNRAAAAVVEADIAALRASRRERADQMRDLDAPDPAQYASADLHWDRWTQEKLVTLQSERARLEAEAEAMRAGARRAFGRREALTGIVERLAAEARRRAARRD